MEIQVVLPVLISFALCIALAPFIIPFLRKLKVGQTERACGVQSHLRKVGTPTMGGLIFLIATTVTTLLFAGENPKTIPILFLMLGFGLIGFLDDYLKVVMRRPDGLYPGQKMLLQIVITGIFAVYMTCFCDVPMTLMIPFLPGKELDLGPLAVPFLFFVVLGTVNGVNFTDGLDGLASGVTMLVAVFFTAAAIRKGAAITSVTAAVIGSLLGFLVFNVFPAQVFMGDTGSLALGGFVAGTAYMLQMPLFLPLVGFIYMAEILSVIGQVTYFRVTHGKRIFKMTPIHHHFELCGWSETRIVAVFSILTALLGLVALMGM